MKHVIMLLALFVTGFSSAQDTLQQPTFKPGTVYGYQTIEILNPWNKKVTKTWEETIATIKDGVPGIIYISEGQKQRRTLDPGHLVHTWDKRKGVWKPIQFPISLGDSWKHEYQYPDPSDANSEYKFEMKGNFVRWEEVTVPAGTFRTALIEHSGYWTRVPSGTSGRTVNRFWYSPELGRFVQEEVQSYASWGMLSNRQVQLTKYKSAP